MTPEQLKDTVKGDTRPRRPRRKRVVYTNILLAVLFFVLWTFVFLFGLMGWRVK